jgi:diaminohydroxyphosphoribosylaminopyrimidine deaminase/5-amino-6-(5-phosphoribosylamino)uracil reductase
MAGRQPLRVAMAGPDGLSPTSRLARTAADHPVLLLAATAPGPEAAALLPSVEVAVIEAGPDGRPDPEAALHALAERGITRVFCEGGPRLGAALLARDLVDDLVLLTGPRPLGIPGLRALEDRARSLLAAPDRFRLAEDRTLGQDRLRRFERLLPCSPD